MPKASHVDADLVGAACENLDGNPGVLGRSLQNPTFAVGRAALGIPGVKGSMDSAVAVGDGADRLGTGEAIGQGLGGPIGRDQGAIDFGQLPLAEGMAQARSGQGRSGNDHQARGATTEAMQGGEGFAGTVLLKLVQQRMGEIGSTGQHRKTAGLVNNPKVWILVQNLEI